MTDESRTASESDERSAEQPSGKDPLRQSRTSKAWVAILGFGLVLVLLIVFIAQNTQSVTVKFLGWKGDAPLAVALLLSAAAAMVVTAVAGTLRILQLRRRVGREKRKGR